MAADIMDFIESIARGAGDILRQHFGSVRTWKTKEDRGDIVTSADLESENYILSRIKKEFPDHNILSEESGRFDISDESCTWYVDPLDGTRNYAMGIPLFCVSIALACAGEIRNGVVYDPVHEELFRAARGKGAFVNDTEISVSDETELDDSLVAISWIRRRVNSRRYLQYTRKMSRHSSYQRRLGSAALMLAYIASGRIEAYLQGGLKPWDVAAGALLVTEAGGVVTDLEDQPLDLTRSQLEILAANPAIHKAIMKYVVREQSTP